MKPAFEGIMYPFDAKASVLQGLERISANLSGFYTAEVPHSAWELSREELDGVFKKVSRMSFTNIFFLSPLHKGPLSYESSENSGIFDGPVFAPSDGRLCGSDWKINLNIPFAFKNLLNISDDVCSEEAGLEIVSPYLAALFPSIPVSAFFAYADSPVLRRIAKIIKKDFPCSLILLSNNKNTGCAGMWKEALEI